MLESDFKGRLPDGVRCIYSRWEGYLEQPDWVATRAKIQSAGGDVLPLHTSGHIFARDLSKFIREVNPRLVVPIHTREPQAFQGIFEHVRVLSDGETFQVP